MRAILGEQLTHAGSTAQIGRIARTFGKPVQSSVPGLTHAFPNAADLADADLSKAGIHGRAARLSNFWPARSVRENSSFRAQWIWTGRSRCSNPSPAFRKARPTTSPCGHWANPTPFPMPTRRAASPISGGSRKRGVPGARMRRCTCVPRLRLLNRAREQAARYSRPLFARLKRGLPP